MDGLERPSLFWCERETPLIHSNEESQPFMEYLCVLGTVLDPVYIAANIPYGVAEEMGSHRSVLI